MAYQSNKTGKQVEEILDNALLKTKQNFSAEEKEQIKGNIGIEDVDLSGYATREETESAIKNAVEAIPTPDVSGQINEHNQDTKAHPYIQGELSEVKASIPTKTSQLANDKGFLTQHQSLAHLATKDEMDRKQDRLVSGKNIRTINGKTLLGALDLTIGDSELSETSTEPIQNKVVTLELKKKQDVIEDIDDIRNGVATATEKATKAGTTADEALRQAEVATDAIATLKGLENSDEAMALIAQEITKIAQNSSDIAAIKEGTVYLTQAEYNTLVENGTVKENVEYNIFE